MNETLVTMPIFASTVTTVVVHDGQVIRRIESSWQHSLQGAQDLELAQAQIDQQHERVATSLREGRPEGPAPRRPEPAAEGVQAALLAWALSFVAEQALGHLGVAPTVALLKRTRRRLASRKPVLLRFQVAENGRVAPETPGPSHLPADAVPIVAEWAVAFLAEAAVAMPQVRSLRVRSVTRMIERELEKVGFYAAFETAAGSIASSG